MTFLYGPRLVYAFHSLVSSLTNDYLTFHSALFDYVHDLNNNPIGGETGTRGISCFPRTLSARQSLYSAFEKRSSLPCCYCRLMPSDSLKWFHLAIFLGCVY